MDMYDSVKTQDSAFEGPVKDAAPRLERVPGYASPGSCSVGSLFAADGDIARHLTPTHSPVDAFRDAPRRRSVSVRVERAEADPHSVADDMSESGAVSSPASPHTQSIGSSTARGVMQDCVEVIVRLKPTATRVPDADIKFKITDAAGIGSRNGAATSGTQPSSKVKDRAAGATPRTSRTRFKDMPGQTLEVWPPTAYGGPGSSTAGELSARSSVASPRLPSEPQPNATATASATSASRLYRFRHVFAPSVTDEEMSASLVPEVLEQLRAQFSVCLLCYGQTGSGKTHTMNALTPELTHAVFRDFVNPDTDVVELSYIQIYNDRPYNLLCGSVAGSGEGSPRRALRSARQHNTQTLGTALPRPYGRDVCEPKRIVTNASQALRLVKHAQALRCTTSHTLNARSSRAHTLMTLQVTRYAAGVQSSAVKLTLADLAGSERLKRSGATGETKDEAIAINGSLSALQSLIQAKAERRPVLPVRETVLNRYLASRVMGWHLMFIVTASVEKDNYVETKSSLDFANISKECPVTKQRARPLGQHSPRWGDIHTPRADADKERIRELETEIASLRQLLTSHGDPSGTDSTSRHDAGAATTGAHGLAVGRGVHLANSQLTQASADENTDADDTGQRDDELQDRLADYAERLYDREEELRQLDDRNRSDDERVDALRERVNAQMDVLRAVCRSPSASPVTTVDAELSLRCLEHYFLQAMEMADEAVERRRVDEKGREVLLTEKAREEAKYASLLAQHQSLQAAHDTAVKGRRELESVVENLRLQLLQEKLERLVGEEESQLLNTTVTREVEEISVYRKQLEDLRGVEQQHVDTIAMLERELMATQTERSNLRRELDDRETTFRLMWTILTPQQKIRFHHDAHSSGAEVGASSLTPSPPPAGSAAATASLASPVSPVPAPMSTAVSLAQGHELIQLRSVVAALRASMVDKEAALRILKSDADRAKQQCEAVNKELADTKAYCDALKHDEERQAAEVFRLETSSNDYALTVSRLHDELKRTREALLAKAKDIERLEEMQRTAQILVSNCSTGPDTRREGRDTAYRGFRPDPHTAATHTTFTAAARPFETTPAVNPTRPFPSPLHFTLTAAARRFPTPVAPTKLVSATTSAARTGPVGPAAVEPTHTTAAPAPAAPSAAAVSAGTSHGTTHRHRPTLTAATRDVRSSQEEDAPPLSSSGSGGTPLFAASALVRASRHTRPAVPRTRTSKKRAQTVPFTQSAPPKAFADPHRLSASILSTENPSVSSTRDPLRGSSAGPRAVRHSASSRRTSRGAPASLASRKPHSVPDTVTVRRPLSTPAVTRGKKEARGPPRGEMAPKKP